MASQQTDRNHSRAISSGTTSVSLSKSLMKWGKAQAAAEERSFSNWLARLMQEEKRKVMAKAAKKAAKKATKLL